MQQNSTHWLSSTKLTVRESKSNSNGRILLNRHLIRIECLADSRTGLNARSKTETCAQAWTPNILPSGIAMLKMKAAVQTLLVDKAGTAATGKIRA